MNTIRKHDAEAFELAGDRLNHLLDQIGFKEGRGRMAAFQTYLAENDPEIFANVKYTTVRSWFQEFSPAMSKIDAIMVALQKHYTIRHDIVHIKTWWKLGGHYPFGDGKGSHAPTMPELREQANADRERLSFVVMSLITDVTGDRFKSLTTEELIGMKEKAEKFAADFADPYQTECPEEYLRAILKAELSLLPKD